MPNPQLSEITQHIDIGFGYPTFTAAAARMSIPKPAGVRNHPTQIEPDPLEYCSSMSKIPQDDRLGIIADAAISKTEPLVTRYALIWLRFW